MILRHYINNNTTLDAQFYPLLIDDKREVFEEYKKIFGVNPLEAPAPNQK
jgi:hypothetical protein